MSVYNKFLENILLPIGDAVFGTSFISNLKKSRNIIFLSQEELLKLQEQNLKKVLLNAQQKCNFYKDIQLKGENPYEWLKEFPIINKVNLNNNAADFIVEDKSKLIQLKSSGSSGIQTIVYMNKEEQSKLRAFQTIWWELAGYKIGHKIFQTGISPKRGIQKSLKDFFFRTNYFSAFNTSEESVLKGLLKIKSDKKTILVGYASSLNFFAEIALKHNLNIELKSVISLGDKLFSHYRTNLQKAFNCKVFDTYGSSEGFLIGFQYDLDYLYQFTPQVFIELLNDKNLPVKDGEMGHVVVTRLDGFSMPLIRYKLGDLAIKLPENEYPKNKKLHFPLFKQIVGRNTDVIKTPDGKILIVHFFTGIFEHFPEIKQYRIIQKQKENISIEIIKNSNFNDETFKKLKETLVEKINDPKLQITYNFVNSIPNTKSGKPEIVKTHIV